MVFKTLKAVKGATFTLLAHKGLQKTTLVWKKLHYYIITLSFALMSIGTPVVESSVAERTVAIG